MKKENYKEEEPTKEEIVNEEDNFKKKEEIEDNDDDEDSSYRKLKIRGKDNKLYSLEICKEKENIIFKAIIEGLKDVISYEKQLSISDFQETNKIYKQFDDIDELFSNCLNVVEESKINIKEEKNKLKLTVIVPSVKDIKTYFELLPKKASMEIMIANLYETSQEQKKEYEIIKEEIEKFKNFTEEIRNKIEEISKTKEICENLGKDINIIKENLEENKKEKELLKEELDNQKKIIEEMKEQIKKQNSEIENLHKKSEENKTYLENSIKEKNDRYLEFLKDAEAKQTMNMMLLNQSKIFFDQQSDILKKQISSYETRIDLHDKHITSINTIIDNNIEQLGKMTSEFEKRMKNNIMEQYIKELTKVDKKYLKISKEINSNILKFDEISLIEEGVKKKLSKNIKEYKLIFKASKDGFRVKDFHNYCDGKDNTLTLVKTKTGRRFGGFTDQKWDQSGSNKSGSNGFLFSLDFKEIYYNNNSSYNIQGNSSYGPYFGNDFYIGDNCNSGYNSSDSSNCYYTTNSKTYALAGENKYIVEDYEVYQIIF